MHLRDFIGKTVLIDGLDHPVVLRQLAGGYVGYEVKGESSKPLGRLFDSVGSGSSDITIRLSRVN